MENALLIGLSRQVALSRELDVIANNVANIGTNGFKARSLRFEEYLMPGGERRRVQPGRPAALLCHRQGHGLDFASGAVERTGNPLDVAMRGNAFLAVQTPQGERYTRNGSLADQRHAASSSPATAIAVLGDGGPILFSQHRDRHQHRQRRHGLELGRRQGQAEAHGRPQPEQPRERRHNLFSATRRCAAAGREVRDRGGRRRALERQGRHRDEPADRGQPRLHEHLAR